MCCSECNPKRIASESVHNKNTNLATFYSPLFSVVFVSPSDHTPSDVCFHQELKRFLPGRSIFNKKKVPQGLPLKNSERDKIFDTARNPDLFYQVIVQLQVRGVVM